MAGAFNLDLSELVAFGADLGRASVVAPEKAGQAVESSGQALAKDMSARSPRLTGAMAASVSMDVQRSGDVTTAVVGPTVSYAGYVNDGTSRQAPQPFLDQSLAAKAPSFLAAVEDVADAGLGF